MHCYLSQRDGSPNWYIYEYDERTGQCERISTRTANREIAERKLAEHILKLPQRQVMNDATLVKVMLRYYQHHGQHVFSAETVRQVMGLVCEHEPETRLFSWSIPKQKEFVEKLARKPNTQRRRWGVVRAAVKWTFDAGEIPSMPPMYKMQAADGEGVRPFELAELTKLANACIHEHERRFFLLALATACRPGATLDLTWDRLDAETGVVDYVVPGRKVTKKRRAKAPLCAPALAYFNDRRSVGPIIQWRGRQLKGFKMTFRRLSARAKVKGTAYGIRKAVSIWLRKEGVPEWDVKGMLGHAIGGETERYAHYRPEYMRAAAASVERLLRKISPPWLASYLPLASESGQQQPQLIVANGSFGARNRDRTCDPHHVKAEVCELIQGLTVANDD